MMRVLIVKTSSMGDVIHTLPALTDAAKKHPDIQFDWLVEENFAEIPLWHKQVQQVIPIAFRRWRKKWWHYLKNGEIKKSLKLLRAKQYDMVIDAQGLCKSAVFTLCSKGHKVGLDKKSAREAIASYFYDSKVTIDTAQHAVSRMRALFSRALHYELPDTVADYGLDKAKLPRPDLASPYLVFLHGTTWATKHWPNEYWQRLAQLAEAAQQHVYLPWGNQAEKERAEWIAGESQFIHVLPKLTLQQMAAILAYAQAVVAVDTGLGHLAAALDVPTISLYGPTDATLTGTQGANQYHLQADFSCSPCLNRVCTYSGESAAKPACFEKLTADDIWQKLQLVLHDSDRIVDVENIPLAH
jgi:heptosyltransferase I